MLNVFAFFLTRKKEDKEISLASFSLKLSLRFWKKIRKVRNLEGFMNLLNDKTTLDQKHESV